jgi:hypothetical protein
MLINEALIKITDEYPKESKGSTLNNPLHRFIRKEVPEIIIYIKFIWKNIFYTFSN